MLEDSDVLLVWRPSKIGSPGAESKGTQQEIVATLQATGVTPNEYFKDLEITGQYPEELQDYIKNGGNCIENVDVLQILEILKEKWIEFVPSKDEILRLPEDKEDELRDLSRPYFGIDDFPLYDFSWEWDMECTIGSNLYTIVKIDWKIYLVWIAGWEFNRRTFTDGSKYFPNASFHKSEIPLFVVNQGDSYFAGKWKPQADIRNIDVRLYLELFTQISSLKPWEASLHRKRRDIDDVDGIFNWSDIKVPEYDELKNILTKKFDGQK